MEKLIKTTYRIKIPKNFSYPIGAEILSHAFKDLKYYDDLEIMFRYKRECFASKFNKTIKQKGEILIFHLEYNKMKLGFKAGTMVYEEGWEIVVYAVPTELRHTIKILFLNDILIKARNWLESLEKELPRIYCGFTVSFDLKTETYQIKKGSSNV